jgi:hypothetical protein
VKKSKLFAVVAAIAMTASLAVTIPARAAGIEMTYLTPAYLKGTVASTERIVADWNKANPNARNAAGVTPLMIAAHKNQDMIISLLLKAGAKADVKDDEGKTALQIAKENDAQKAIAMLESNK